MAESLNIRFKRGTVVELKIDDLAFGGKGISRIETEKGNFVVFVPNTIPGQLVRARISKKKNKFAEAKLMDILEHSPREGDTPYQTIPGAPYARLPLEEQAEFKQASTLELFRRIGAFEEMEEVFDEYINSPLSWHYRNKMEYSFSAIRYDLEQKCDVDDFGLGFKHRGTWWMVENLDKDSGLFDPIVENQLKDIRQWCIDSGLPAWHPPQKVGFYRYLVVRKSFASGKLLFDLVTSTNDIEKFDKDGFVNYMQSLFGDRLAGVIHTLNDDIGDRPRSSQGTDDSTLLCGEDKLVETLHGLDFEMSMQSFFQPNPGGAELLYGKAVEYVLAPGLEYAPADTVMDLFCGTGTIAQVMTRRLEGIKVIGVDIVPEAIEDAKQNAARNRVDGVEFFAADVGKFLYEYPQYQGKIKTIVMDPPRAGIAPKTLLKVIALEAERIVYVSCNPATQSRDASTLADAGYVLKKLSLVDQFPHTSHIESVALFERKAEG